MNTKPSRSKEDAETETLGVGDEIDFDAEIEMAQKKNLEQAELAEDMIKEAKEMIKDKDYAAADGMLYKIKNFWSQAPNLADHS